MISVQQATSIIEKNTSAQPTVTKPLLKGLGSVLGADIFSPIDMPPFNQSAMDGYALNYHESNLYTLIGEVKAGDEAKQEIKPGEAIRIFTGAMTPKGCNTIAKQEIVERDGVNVSLTESISIGTNIRLKGEQIKQNELAVKKGTLITPGVVGFLATLGINEVEVTKKPRITIIATGNELTPPGSPLSPGKIYESNTFMLQAALLHLGFEAQIETVKDDYTSTKNKIEAALKNNDILLMTGGISVGDYDFVGKALNELGVESLFYKVKQKPGKPIFYGKWNNTTVFGLPGNPAAALSCFYLYVLKVLTLLSGGSNSGIEERTLNLSNDYNKTPKMTHFLKAKATNKCVEILPAQSSAMLSSFTEANCIAILEEGRESWKKGDEITVLMLP